MKEASIDTGWYARGALLNLAQAIGKTVIDQGDRVICREAHILLEEIAEATLDGNRKEHMKLLSTVPLLIIR
jgi:hypothetical protein